MTDMAQHPHFPPPDPTTRSDAPAPPRRHSRLVAVGVAIGLIGGAGMATALGVSPFASAAPVTTEVPAVSSAPATPPSSDAGPGGVDDGRRNGMRERAVDRLRDRLAPLVEDGTISEAQRDAVVERLLDDAAGPGGWRPGHHGGPGNGRSGGDLGRRLADELGVDIDELRERVLDKIREFLEIDPAG
jgi:hypothetical protein